MTAAGPPSSTAGSPSTCQVRGAFTCFSPRAPENSVWLEDPYNYVQAAAKRPKGRGDVCFPQSHSCEVVEAKPASSPFCACGMLHPSTRIRLGEAIVHLLS